MLHFKLWCIFLVLAITVVSGAYPFIKKIKTKHGLTFPSGESLAAGVFLGAGLMHMLGDSAQEFYQLHYNYPLGFLLAGATFLFLLLIEHVGQEIYKTKGEGSAAFAVLATLMLVIHSFLEGAALGITMNLSLTIIILLAIVAHKWAASFALAVQINKSHLPIKLGVFLFAIFCVMTPLGILVGAGVCHSLAIHPLAQPIFSALAAGTFLYLGTLHGLDRATLIAQCCNLKRFVLVIVGFAIMAVVAVWT